MTAVKPKKPATPKPRTQAKAEKAATKSRKRPVTKPVSDDPEEPTSRRPEEGDHAIEGNPDPDREQPTSGGQPEEAASSSPAAPRDTEPSRQVEKLAILALALVLGLFGLIIHALWLGAIVLMALLLGWGAAELKGHRGRGVISQVVAEAKNVVADVAATVRDGPDAEDSLRVTTDGTKEQSAAPA
jgi:hypothetical protein